MDFIDIFHLIGALLAVAGVFFFVRMIGRLRQASRDAKRHFDEYVAQQEAHAARQAAHERELQTRENEFRLLSMSLPIGVFKMTIANELTYVNTRFLEILGISFEDNFEVDWLSFVMTEDRDRLMAALDESKLKFREMQCEFRVRGTDGDVRWVELRLSAAISDDEIHFIGIIEDIGDRKRAEEELRAAKEAAERTAQEKNRLLATLSHQIRQQMNTVVGISQLLRDSSLSSEQQEQVGLIRTAGATLLALIEEREAAHAADERPLTEGMAHEAAAEGNDHSAVSSVRSAEAASHDARILLVEDNLVNQKVAAKMLSRLGLSCDIAYHGAEAVEACGKKRYDLILMDCQMPIMDGFEATRRIRAFEEGGASTPVIAMTANVMRGDRERCMAVGMNDYLAKPVTMEALRAVLDRYGLQAVTAEERVRPAADTALAPDGRQTFDLAVLHRTSENDRRFEQEMLDLFIKDTRKRIDTLRRLVAAGTDLHTIRIEAHAIKGSCGNIGVKAMQEAAYRLEKLAADGVKEGMPALLEKLAAEFVRAEEAIQKYRRTTLAGLA